MIKKSAPTQLLGSRNRLDVDFLALLADCAAAARVVSASAEGSAMQAVLELDVRTERGNVALMNSPRIHCATEDEPRILKALEKEEKIQSRH